MQLSALVETAMVQRASDVHLVAGLPVMLRVAGEIATLGADVLTEQMIREMIEALLSDEQRLIFAQEKQLCFSTVMESVAHVRISVYTHLGRTEAALRLRPLIIPPLDSLGLPAVVGELTRRPNGLILVTGPTGVGKTTTLYAMIDRINSERRAKIITVEDPVEYLHPHKRSIVIQQEIGQDAKSFHSALIHILRLDPDVICIGEMRDGPTISAALLAAETGHLVMATLHTTSAAQTMERIVTAVPSTERGGATMQLATVLQGVITQELLPTVDGRSRVLGYEIMLANSAVRNNIREGKYGALNDIIQSSAEQGMRSMDMCLRDLYQTGKISFDVAATHARDPKLLHGPGLAAKRKP